MDADGTCLVVSPCNSCRINKNGVQACIIRKHNARLTAVKKEDLAARHRQCIKPDQAITIFKLVDRETGEESVEFDPDMVFQRPCPSCIHLKTCIQGGHQLTDWTPDGGGGRAPRNKRKSASSSPSKSPTSQAQAQLQQEPSSKARKLSDESKPSLQLPSPSITIPGPALKAAAAAAAAAAPEPGLGRLIEAAAESAESEGRPRRRSAKARRASAPPARSGDPRYRAVAGADPDATDSEGDATAAAANGRSGDVSNGSAPPQSIASQLDALAVQEDLLLQQYQVDMRHLDEAKAAREKEIVVAQAALENIKATRETTKSNIAEQRKKMVTERDRLTHLRCQEMIREEAEHRQKKDVLWSAVEPAATPETTGGSGSAGGSANSPGPTSSFSLTAHSGLGAATQPPPSPVADRPEDGVEERCAALLLPSPSASVLSPRSGASPPSAVTPIVAADEKLALGERAETAAGAGAAAAVEISGGEPAAGCKEETSHTPCSLPRGDGDEVGNDPVQAPKAGENPTVESGAGSSTTAAAAAGRGAPAFETEKEEGEKKQEQEKAGCTAAGNGAAPNGLPKEGKVHQGGQSSAVVVGVGDSNGNQAAAQGKRVVEDDEAPVAVGIAPKKTSDAVLASGAAAGPGPEGASVQANGGTGHQSDGGDSMDVDDGEDEREREEKAEDGDGGGGSDLVTPVPASKGKGGGTTPELDGAGAVVKAPSAGGSGRTTRHGARQGPPHGGVVS